MLSIVNAAKWPRFCRRNIWKASLGTIAALASVILMMSANAQLAGQGAIQGRVTDSTGAVIPGATVQATDVTTGVKTTRLTTNSGVYLLSPLPAGQYTVTVTAKGFAKTVQEHVVVNATQSVGLDFALKVGTQSESVTVTTAPPALDTTDATLSETMQNQTYSALPLEVDGGPRDPTAFAGLMPGVGSGGPSGTYNGGGGSGGRVDEVYVDGVPVTAVNMQGNAQPVSQAISVDAVNQFQVITSGASAQYTGLGIQNFDIKSGTNRFHGSVADYIRNTMFDSWGFFAKSAKVPNAAGQLIPAPKPSEHQNELALTIGGPILHNRLFFFTSYDKYHQTYGVNPSLYSIPSMAERQGDFTALNYPIYDPTTYQACTTANNGTPCVYQFHGLLNGVDTPNVIPQSEISPQSQYMQKFLPAPTGPGTQGNLLAGTPGGNDNWELTAKVDYQMTPNQRFSVLSNSGTRSFLGIDGGGLPAPYTNGRLVTEKTTSAILEYSLVLSPNMVNNIKYGYIRNWAPALDPWYGVKQYEAATAVGIGNLPPGQASLTFPNVKFSGFADNPTNWPTSNNNSYAQTVNTYDLVDNLQWTAGQHSLTFGFLYQWLDQNDGIITPTNPVPLGFSNVNTAGYANGKIQNTTTGNSYASFLLGAVNSSSMKVQPYEQLGARMKAISPSVEDNWRVNSNLTLNLGLRWDFFTPYQEVLNRWSFLNMGLINPATGTPGAIQFAGNGSDGCNCSTPVHTYWGNFGPRLGMAYSLGRKTVLRAAFSTMYSHSGGVGGQVGANYGTGQAGLTGTASFPSSGQSGAIPAFYLNANLSAPYKNTSLPAYTSTPLRSPIVNSGNYIDSTGAAVTAQSVSYADPYLSGRAPYSEYWNVGVQRAITRDLTIRANYAGSESHFLTGGSRGVIINQLDPKYEALGGLLKQLPGNTDKATGETYLQEAQAIIPGIGLPYSNFGGSHATIEAMLQPHPQYSKISDTWGDIGNARYDSFQVSLTQRPVHGLSYTVNYTYSRERDDTGTFRTGYDIPASAITDGIARSEDALEYTPGTGETPQALRAFGVWDLPFGRRKSGTTMNFVNDLIRGWALSGIYSYTSGSPLAITASGCEAVGLGTCMPSYTPGYGKSPRRNGGWGKHITPLTASVTPYLDASAFTVPNVTYQVGNIPRTGAYGLFGPGSFDIDSSLRRTFRITERVKFILQADTFNLTNAVRFRIASVKVVPQKAVSGQSFNSIGTNTGSNFGTISGQSNSPRDWQFSGHITF